MRKHIFLILLLITLPTTTIVAGTTVVEQEYDNVTFRMELWPIIRPLYAVITFKGIRPDGNFDLYVFKMIPLEITHVYTWNSLGEVEVERIVE